MFLFLLPCCCGPVTSVVPLRRPSSWLCPGARGPRQQRTLWGSSLAIIRATSVVGRPLSLPSELRSGALVLNESAGGRAPEGPTLFSFLCERGRETRGRTWERQENVTFFIFVSVSSPHFTLRRELDLSALG